MFVQIGAVLASLQLLHLFQLAIALPTELQYPQYRTSKKVQAVRAKLKKAEIIPTVIHDFTPSLTLSVAWPKKEADLGNTIQPEYLQDQPSITLLDDTNTDGSATSNMTYVVTLTDPDAPSRQDPKWSEMCHWIASNVSLSQETVSARAVPLFSVENYNKNSTLDEVVQYKPPGPPAKTGKHRYVFLVFAPRNGTTLPLKLSKPKDRQHWGTGKKRGGVKDWAKENQLVPVAANFIYSQNKKQ